VLVAARRSTEGVTADEVIEFLEASVKLLARADEVIE
jgi:hypothetical protein